MKKTNYVITSCKDLESIGEGENYPGATHTETWTSDGFYTLGNDIDCSGTNPLDPEHDTIPETTFGGNGFDAIVFFTGKIEGNGYSINNLYTTSRIVDTLTSSGLIDNIVLNNPDEIINTIGAGGLINDNSGSITNVDINNINLKSI